MKKTFLLPLLFFQIIGFSQIINIPDINFKNKLINASASNSTAGGYIIDTNNDDEIEVSEAQQITYLDVIISNISDLTGIEYFTNLNYLYIEYNTISNINISSLSSLIILRCDYNNLNSINLSGLNNLEGINIAFNQIDVLNSSSLPNLKSVICDHNQLTTLDFSNNPLLTKLKCSNNNLTSINLKNGINQDFSNVNFNDCWKTGNPNLATICVDASELTSVQNHLNNCGTAQTINITSNCGLGSEEFVDNKIVLYPNPTSSIININGSETIERIELYDSLGRVLVSKFIESNQSSLDLSNYSNGIYFVKIITDNGEKTEKVLKQ